MGLTDEMIEGVWQWVDTDEKMTFSDWVPGEPNNYQNMQEDCAVLIYYEDFKWNDMLCENQHFVICKKR